MIHTFEEATLLAANRIRVLLAVQPQVLCDCLAELIKREPDIELVGCISDPVDLLVAARATEPHVVVTGSEDGAMPGVCTHLFGEFPSLLVVAVSEGAEQSKVFRQEISARSIPSESAQGLVASIRQALGWTEGRPANGFGQTSQLRWC